MRLGDGRFRFPNANTQGDTKFQNGDDDFFLGITSAGSFDVQPRRSTAANGETDPDIFFQCNHCQASLVVNRAAAGMRLNCQRCGKPTVVPMPSEATADAAEQGQEIQRKLKENESQRTEVTGYINQVSIQLHRWQLRLQTLNERKQQLEKELALLKT